MATWKTANEPARRAHDWRGENDFPLGIRPGQTAEVDGAKPSTCFGSFALRSFRNKDYPRRSPTGLKLPKVLPNPRESANVILLSKRLWGGSPWTRSMWNML